MADVRCSMCGKLNPADATVCRYCQARLKPLAENPVEPEASGNQPPEESSDDWLHGLLAPSGAAEEPAEEQGEAPVEPKAEIE